MPDSLRRYVPSGYLRLATLLLFLVGALGGILVAWLYQLLMDLIPFIYINVLLCAGFGGLLGLAGIWAVRSGHCRNRLVALLLALPLAAVPLAASYYWGYRSTVRDLTKQRPEIAKIMGEHYTMKNWLEDKQSVGWQLKSSTINGGFVMAVWVGEAAIVVGLVLFIVWGAVSEPYCERCNRWGVARALRVAGRDRKDVDPLLAARDLEAVIQLAPSPESDGNRSLLLTATVCDRCLETGFLSVKEQTFTIRKGKREAKTIHLASNLVMRADQRARFLARLHGSSVVTVSASG